MKNKAITDEVLYDIMSIVDDKLSPQQIQHLFEHPEEIDTTECLTSMEKICLREEFEEIGSQNN